MTEPPMPPVLRAPGRLGSSQDGGGNGSSDGGPGDGAGPRDEPPRPRVYKLRLALILAGLGALAMVSTVFGMMMAVASDLPALESRQEYKYSRNSVLYDVNGKQVGVLTGNQNRILVSPTQIAPAMQQAIIAIEDQRFYEHSGIDPRGIARALIADITRKKAVQGASTIPQQFVKNALAAQGKRTIFEKLREAALAYHLTRKWSKEKILAEYLNSIYFGNGAWGIESAARTYFGFQHPGCGETGQPNCASLLTPAESALIAGLVASPYAWDPIAHPRASLARRNLVLAKMLVQRRLTRAEYEGAVAQKLPDASTIAFPREDSQAPYFTSWVKQQVVDRFGAIKAFNGGLRVKTTLDLDLQNAAQQAVANHLSDPAGPTAAVVVIDNRTGEVRAMVGGRPGKSFNQAPFNLATQGQRQPGSAFKAFVLAQALRDGITPDTTFTSQRKELPVPGSGGREKFVVNNFEGEYAGVRTLADATANSDNSVYAELGLRLGPARIARLAQEMGIRTPVSTNPAITLGGLKQGVTPLDMAHAFETLAAGGSRISGTLGAPDDGPVGIREVYDPLQRRALANQRIAKRVVSRRLAQTETDILTGVVSHGTGTNAATGGFAAGKTGTTENSADAWFVGFNRRWTVAVWVGYPDSLREMNHDFNGGPVVGGSYPAQIWHDFIVAADAIVDQRAAERAAREGRTYTAPPDSSGSRSATDMSGTGDGSGTGAPDGSGSSTPEGPSSLSGGGGSSGAGSGGGDTGGGPRRSGGGPRGGGRPSGGGGAPRGGGGGAPSGGTAGGTSPG